MSMALIHHFFSLITNQDRNPKIKAFSFYFDGDEVDEPESSGATLVVGDEVDLVDVAVLGEVTLEIATRRGVAAISISTLET